MTFSRISIEKNPDYQNIRHLVYAFYNVHYKFSSLEWFSGELISLVFDPDKVLASKKPDPINQQLSLILKDPACRHLAVYAILDLYIYLFEKNVATDTHVFNFLSHQWTTQINFWREILLWAFNNKVAGVTECNLSDFRRNLTPTETTLTKMGEFNALEIALRFWQPAKLTLKNNRFFNLFYDTYVWSSDTKPKIRKALKKLILYSNATELDLSWNVDKNSIFLHKAPWKEFASMLVNVKSLNLSGNYLKQTFQFSTLINIFAQRNQAFDFLDLSFNHLSRWPFFNTLSRLHVKSLRFCGNFVEDRFSNSLIDAFTRFIAHSPYLEELNLSNNKLHHLSDAQFEEFCKALAKSNITKLILTEKLTQEEKFHLEIRSIRSKDTFTKKHLSVEENKLSPTQMAILDEIIAANLLKQTKTVFSTGKIGVYKTNPGFLFKDIKWLNINPENTHKKSYTLR